MREATWLNADRARIPEMLSLRLEPETARPLAEATRPNGPALQKLAVKLTSPPAGPPADASAKRFISRHISMKGSS